MPNLIATTDLCRLLGDPSRVRLLALLAQEELTVAELTRVTHLAQSRVSTHLRKLRNAGMLRSRRDGSFTYYALNQGSMPEEARGLWEIVRETAQDPLLERDQLELAAVIRGRNEGTSWADSVAGNMARHYSPGRTWESMIRGLVGLTRLGRVLDLASGDGTLAELLASRSKSIVCVDISQRVVRKGQERLREVPNLTFRCADMHALPFEDASFDQCLLMSSLSYTSDPEQVLREVARVLVPGGALVGIALRQHNHGAIVAEYDHVHMGFEPSELRELLVLTGFDVDRCEATMQEPRPPHFELITIHAARASRT